MKRKRKPQDELKIQIDDDNFFHEYPKPALALPVETGVGWDEYSRVLRNTYEDDSDRDSRFRSALLLDMAGQGRNYEEDRAQLMRKIFPNLPMELSLQIAQDAWRNAHDREERERLKDYERGEEFKRYYGHLGPRHEDYEVWKGLYTRKPTIQLPDYLRKK
jgi:hypothetical protein